MLIGNDAPNNLYGYGGPDNITGAGGRDDLRGEDGDDRLNAGPGPDLLEGGPDQDVLEGGADFDGVWHPTAQSSVTVSLAAGSASGGAGNDVISAIEAIDGSAYNDILTGDDLNNTIHGRGGADTIVGRGRQGRPLRGRRRRQAPSARRRGRPTQWGGGQRWSGGGPVRPRLVDRRGAVPALATPAPRVDGVAGRRLGRGALPSFVTRLVGTCQLDTRRAGRVGSTRPVQREGQRWRRCDRALQSWSRVRGMELGGLEPPTSWVR